MNFSDETSGKHVKFVCEFWDEKWCKNRSVTDVNWSLKVSSVLNNNYLTLMLFFFKLKSTPSWLFLLIIRTHLHLMNLMV